VLFGKKAVSGRGAAYIERFRYTSVVEKRWLGINYVHLSDSSQNREAIFSVSQASR